MAFVAAAVAAGAVAPVAWAPNPPPDPGDTPSSACVVPNVKRKALVDALAALTSAHCAAGAVRYAVSGRVPAGRVISQRPRPGVHLGPAGRVRLVVSRGRR
jgi:beta-lactam-binding protein with PASTA domain